VWAVIVAAGSGERFGGPKQFELLGGRTVVDHAAAMAREVVDGVVVVVPVDRVAAPSEVAGGATRSESVRLGLAAVPPEADVILVHDGARPFASADLYRAVIAAVRGGADGAVPGIDVTDTIKVVDDARTVVSTPERATLVAVQTPQAFRAAALRRAHAAEPEATDDASLVEDTGGKVVVVEGSPANLKITRPIDLAIAEALLRFGAAP
jgi:2-C-methyl-D-erythritol 4-phosphate cytidylyltransferase